MLEPGLDLNCAIILLQQFRLFHVADPRAAVGCFVECRQEVIQFDIDL